jgi:hypothetical protein
MIATGIDDGGHQAHPDYIEDHRSDDLLENKHAFVVIHVQKGQKKQHEQH